MPKDKTYWKPFDIYLPLTKDLPAEKACSILIEVYLDDDGDEMVTPESSARIGKIQEAMVRIHRPAAKLVPLWSIIYAIPKRLRPACQLTCHWAYVMAPTRDEALEQFKEIFRSVYPDDEEVDLSDDSVMKCRTPEGHQFEVSIL